LGRGAPEPEASGDQLVLGGAFGDDVRLDPGHVLPVAFMRVHELREGCRALVRAVELEGVLEVLDDDGPRLGTAVAVGDVGRHGVERAPEGFVAALGFGQVAVDEIPPPLPLCLVVLDCFRGGRIVGEDLEQALVSGDGLVGVDELLLVDAGQLGLHRGLHRSAGRERDLELEQARDRAPFAPLRMPSARRTKEPLDL
jgi:hypothetical protein